MSDTIELLDISEAAQVLNVSETSLRRWTNVGVLPCLRIGLRRERRFRRADLLSFMEQPAAAQLPYDGKGGSMKVQDSRDVAPSRVQGVVLKAMKRRRSSLDSDIKAGRFIVSEHQKSPSAQCRFFETGMEKAENEGVDSFRVVGDMWGLRLKVSAKQMIQLEIGFERLIVPRFPVVALCTYDARKFTGVELLDALKDHDDTFKIPIGRMLA